MTEQPGQGSQTRPARQHQLQPPRD